MANTDDLKNLLPLGEGGKAKTWNLTTTAAALAAALGTRALLRSGWRRVTGDDPPNNPAASSVGWGDALAWTAATGVGVGVARLLAHRGAAAGWKKATGHKPPV